MRKTHAAAAVAVLGAGAVLGVPALASAHGARVIELVARAPQTSALTVPCPDCFVQRTPDGAHIGGVQYDTGSLVDRTGHDAGHFALVSSGVSPFGGENAPGELALSATMALADGQIVAQGLEEPPLDGGTLAVVGGTGRYRDAHGVVRYGDSADGSTNLHVELDR